MSLFVMCGIGVLADAPESWGSHLLGWSFVVYFSIAAVRSWTSWNLIVCQDPADLVVQRPFMWSRRIPIDQIARLHVRNRPSPVMSAPGLTIEFTDGRFKRIDYFGYALEAAAERYNQRYGKSPVAVV